MNDGLNVNNIIQLNNRSIDHCGNTIVTPDQLMDLLDSDVKFNDKVFVTEMTNVIKRFNRYSENPIQQYGEEHQSIAEDSYIWNIPEKYKNIKITKYAIDKLSEIEHQFSDKQWELRVQRIKFETNLIKKHNLTNLFRTLIYCIDKMIECNMVWGVGRGSSVACYVMYLMQLHDVDSVEYEIDPLEFFKTR